MSRRSGFMKIQVFLKIQKKSGEMHAGWRLRHSHNAIEGRMVRAGAPVNAPAPGRGAGVERRSGGWRPETAEREVAIAAVDVVADVVPAEIPGGHAGGAGAGEGIEDEVAFEAEEIDEAFRELDREGGWMSGLPGRFGGNLPDREGVAHELLLRDGALSATRPLELSLRIDQDVFVNVAQRRVVRRTERTPRARAVRPARLFPDDLAALEKAEPVHEARDVRRERDVRAAADVGKIDAGAPARLEDAVRLPKDAPEKLQVILERKVVVVLLPDVVRRGGDHEGDG